jgi:DNA-binding transcriptional LysR family regulator
MSYELHLMEPSDFALLATLDALLQEGSVTGAARRVGLSTPAMSHALARIRERLGDPVLVRAGRGMVLTPRAESLKARVHTVVIEAQQTLEAPRSFAPAELDRTFVVHASDYVLTVLGLEVDRMLGAEAPLASLRFVPNAPDDAAQLREGGSDLAVGIYGDLPPEMRHRQLLTDRFVCVVRSGLGGIGRRLSLEQFTRLAHVQVAPRGLPGGYVDDVLRARGLTRRVARAVPYFRTALELVARTDYVLTISERVAASLGPSLGLRLLEPPLALRPYALSLVWHPRFDGDAGHRFLREVFTRAAKEVAADRHDDPRTKLDATDPTSGAHRRRGAQPRPPKRSRRDGAR